MEASFDKLANNVLNARKNWGAPAYFRTLESVAVTDLNEPFVIDKAVIFFKRKYDKATDGYVTTKDGRQVFQPVVFVAMEDGRFFATKSSLMYDQLAMLANIDVMPDQEKVVEVPDVSGMKARIDWKPVKYHNGREYDQPVLADAE